MSTINSWKANIKAQEVLLNLYSEPFTILFNKVDKDGFAYFTIDQKDPLENILPFLKKSFAGINIKDIHIKDGYLLYDASKSPKKDQELQEFSDANYFEFSYNPCFSGYIKMKENPFNWLEDIIGQKPDKDGQIIITFNDINRINEIINTFEGFSLSSLIGGIFKVSPSKYYLDKQFDLVKNYLVSTLGISSFTCHGHYSTIVIENFFLKEQAVNYIKGNSIYQKSHHRIIFAIRESTFNSFLETRHARHIYFFDEDIKNDEERIGKRGVILPTPRNNEFHIILKWNASIEDVRFEISHYKRVFQRYFGKDEVDVRHHHIFHIDRSLFTESLQNTVKGDKFSVSIEKETISFDFTNEEELYTGLEELKKIQIVDVIYKGPEHRFKVKVEYNSPLQIIQEQLARIPALKTKLVNYDLKLLFFCFFDNHDILQLLISKIKDIIDPLLNDDLKFQFDELKGGKLKYFINFRQDEFETDTVFKFNYLRREEISVFDNSRQTSFGTIEKIDYPSIGIQIDDLKDSICAPNSSVIVCCSLKGERDKIKRLSDTIDIIFSKGNNKIINDKLRSILVDSSKADTFPGNIILTKEYKEIFEDISSSFLSKDINSSQAQAIAKCLLSKDLFIIQGPPGTGKSTAISELIWQHIRYNINKQKDPYRILITSETNLAVDNALDKLRSKNHMLIKPVRFGSEDKLDKEGKRFSLEALKEWVAYGNVEVIDETTSSNIIQDWITIIVQRSRKETTGLNKGLTERWSDYLGDANPEIRSLFYNKYLQYTNVLGATCSSIGKLNSENKFTRFFTDYCSVVHPNEYKKYLHSRTKETRKELKSINIGFDLVVQDEASKASPPELALPCLYGKKSVVIGDHRQLPPMVDTNEFIDNLKMTAKRTKDENNKSDISLLISYIKNNREEFSISHFEKLFKAIPQNLKSSFNIQYRMHPAINETIKQFYIEDGGLECGIPDEILDSEDMSHPLNRFHGVTSNRNTHVIWLDVNTPEIKSGTSRINYGEVQAVDWLLSYFQKSVGYKKFIDFWSNSEIEQKQIGIITFYGAQTRLLNKLKEKYPTLPLRISPVDRFQGMERNIVIVSLVRSNSIAEFHNQAPNLIDYPETGYPKQESLGFAEFPNRLNVALSRAKRLLIIVGNSQHFRKQEIYDRVYETIKKHPNGSVKIFDGKTLK